MKLVDAQFAGRPQPPRWVWLLPFAALCIAGALAVQAWRNRAALEALQRSPTQAQDAASTPAVASYEASARQFIVERSGTWAAALSALESGRVAGTFIVGVEWAGADDAMRVDAAARDHGNALALLEALISEGRKTAPALQWSLVRVTEAAEGQGVRAHFVARPARDAAR